MNEEEIEYNLLEVEKGNKRYGIYLKNHIQDQKKEIDRLKLHIIAIKEAISIWNLEYEEGYNEFKIPKKIMDVVWSDKD